MGSFLSLGYLYKRYPSVFEGLIHDCERGTGKSFYCLLLPSYIDKESIEGIYSLLQNRLYFCSLISSYSIEE